MKPKNTGACKLQVTSLVTGPLPNNNNSNDLITAYLQVIPDRTNSI